MGLRGGGSLAVGGGSHERLRLAPHAAGARRSMPLRQALFWRVVLANAAVLAAACAITALVFSPVTPRTSRLRELAIFAGGDRR